MKSPAPRNLATTFRLTPADRSAVTLLQQHLGETDYPMSRLLREGLRELLRKHGLKLEPAPPAKRARR